MPFTLISLIPPSEMKSQTLQWRFDPKQLEVQAETEQTESKALEKSMNGLGEGK